MSQAVINFGKWLYIELRGTGATVFGAILGVAIGTAVVIGVVVFLVINAQGKNLKAL